MDQGHCYVDRESKKRLIEPVYFERTMNAVYGSRIGRWLANVASSYLIFSRFYGWLQRLPITKKKIVPFVRRYEVNAEECTKELSAYRSFDDFFTRKLRPEARPIVQDENIAVAPADGRYLIYKNVSEFGEFVVKSKKFSLENLLGRRKDLVEEYSQGAMVIIRLAPFDYHRFHFPFDCVPSQSQLISGKLHSVHPLAMRDYFVHFCENKRMLTVLDSKMFGKVLYLEIGAMNVGSIHNTFIPGKLYRKGEEKGFFSFGGSSIILLFRPNVITFDEDLVCNSRMGLETFCKVGQSLGFY
ncbi:phosphatidylserine decarboxylase [Chlamydiifrater phoenicopteri]|uniref:phosphatidylserine decarboxylase n=1 Tax=Chlamydiifrater phoenicopteri TaxID=2681469 RepID=UPI001BCC0DD7|nr:phosphatidylserine decarboxylase [Chlamydiifrater phoenicopteri]